MVCSSFSSPPTMTCQLVTFHAAAMASPARADRVPAALSSTTTTTTTSDAGHRRRMRRAQNVRRRMAPVSWCSRSSSDVMRNPLNVKNTETPMNPPRNHPSSPDIAHAWNATTAAMHSPRMPSSDGS